MASGRALHVAIDGSELGPSRRRGIGTYIAALLHGMADRDDLRITVLAPADAPVPPGIAHRPIVRRAPRRLRLVEHDWQTPRELRAVGADVLHVPGQLPLRGTHLPWVHTLHDLTPLGFDDPALAKWRRRWLRRGPLLRNAAAVIADSESTAQDGIRSFGLDPGRVHVIHLGVGSQFHPDGPATAADEPYLLYVGAWGPHKGFAEAMEVIARLADAGYPHRLVMAGPNDTQMRARIAEVARLAPRPDRVEQAGYVEDLAALYRGAAALIVTSRAEGFGLPAAEAMACGTPVVSFANTSLPEVVGTGGVLVADGDVEAMVVALRGLLDDGTARKELAERAVGEAKRFDWQVAVDAHVAVYRSVAGT